MPKHTVETLAADLAAAGKRTQAQITKERLEAEGRTKKRPAKAQAEPEGLFEQTQGALFGRTPDRR